MPQISIPHNYFPRTYQLKFFQAMQGPQAKRNAVLVWHRRAGKDKTALNFIAAQMWNRVGTYYYFFPTYAQGKKVLWDGMGKDGFKFMDHFPEQIVESRNETEMQIKLTNGSIFQIVGTDKIDSIMGTNPLGCVFSEYALQNPEAYQYVRPILAENGGWAVFVYTPRGKNHGWDLMNVAKANPKTWYLSVLTVEETLQDAPGENGLPVFTMDKIEEERLSGMSEELVQQEYFCSFEGAMEGSYYGDLIARAAVMGRMHSVPEFLASIGDPSRLVLTTAWDLGMDDATAIILATHHPMTQEPYILGYYENEGEGLEHYITHLYSRSIGPRPVKYGLHLWPWDAAVREWSSGKTRYQTAVRLGLNPVHVLPKIPHLMDGINGTRQFLARAHWVLTPEIVGTFRSPGLLDRIKSYRREFDETTKTWGLKPVHDWTSHGADAIRYLAQGWHLDAHLIGSSRPTAALTEASQWANTLDVQTGEWDFLDKKSTESLAESDFNPYTT